MKAERSLRICTSSQVIEYWYLYIYRCASKCVSNKESNKVTLKHELVDTNAYKLQPSLSERVVVDGHGCHTALHFGVKAKENQDKVPTLYWLP